MQSSSVPVDARRRARGLAALLAAGLVGACGDSGGGSAQGGFQLTSISVPEGATWQINRPIKFTFNQDVDFDTVSFSSISIADGNGNSAQGEFFFEQDPVTGVVNRQVIVFQPTCPREDDLSDAGLAPNGVTYQILVLGQQGGQGIVVENMSGTSLASSQSRTFTTPASILPDVIYLDPQVGAPQPLVRDVGSSQENTSRIVVGGDADDPIYFEQDNFGGIQLNDLPLNLYSDEQTSIEIFLELNQPVNPDESNVSVDRIFLEIFDESSGTFSRVASAVELVRNCTQTGATVRLVPQGILPQDTLFRVVVSEAFEDLKGETNLLPLDGFGIFRTESVQIAGLDPTDVLGDEVFESFDVGGPGIDSLEDADALFAEPRAIWGGGKLTAEFDFDGTGGPGGDFDYVVPSGQTVVIDTSSTVITGGPGGAPTKTQSIVGGLVNVRDLIVEAGATWRVQGPNTLRVRATRDVKIFGTIDASGFDAKNVGTLNTANQPEPGAPGVAGSGRGGTGSFLTTTSTPKGGDGSGAFGVPGLGGKGGESGFNGATQAKDKRRPGGGGGGRFGPDELMGDDTAMGGGPAVGLVAKPGTPGGAQSFGALSGSQPASGGAAGLGPFVDGIANDFLGVQLGIELDAMMNPVGEEFVEGELSGLWAGSGGGAGGDAVPSATFPSMPFTADSDEKGAGGASGGGGIQIHALNTIVFGPSGRINARGGTGAAGENVLGTDRIGGGSGGGSGGHVVLGAGRKIHFSQDENGVTQNPSPSLGNPPNFLTAKGGKGGPGSMMNTINAGGDGGPGVIQLHIFDQDTSALGHDVLWTGVPDDPAATGIVVPPGFMLVEMSSPDAVPLLPTFSPTSRARSRFIALGGAADNDVFFGFGGTDAMGDVVSTLETVEPLKPIRTGMVSPDQIVGGGSKFRFTAGGLIDPSPSTAPCPGDPSFNDVYLRNPCLLEEFSLRLVDANDPSVFQDFRIVGATYNPVNTFVTLTIDSAGPTLESFCDPTTDACRFELRPRFFRVSTGGTLDFLPDGASVTLRFQGVDTDANGDPDVANPVVDWTPDACQLDNALVEFFRFEVLFDIDAMGTGFDAKSPRPALEFLRVPFRFGEIGP